MSHVRSSRWKPTSILLGYLIALAMPLLAIVPAFAATACTWASQTSVTCGSETFSSPKTNGNTMTLTGNTSAGGNDGGSTTCPNDTLVIANYQTAKSGKETTYTAQVSGKFGGTSCNQNVTSASLTNTYKTAGTANCPSGQSKDANGTCTASAGAEDALSCGSGALSWIICPVINLAVDSANKLDSFIMNSLDVDVKPIFDQTGTKGSASQGYYIAWNSFRILATAVLVIGALIMVTAQALGFEALDAYTVRKVLPRLLVAVIGISLSWPLMRFIILFFDTLGIDIRQIMYSPFSNFGGTLSVSGGILTTLGAGAAIFLLGFTSITLILTALLAVFVGFLILIIRQVAIVMLIIVAPFAIACYILPNTQRVWKLWYDNFLGLMLMFPIISALIAAGHIFAAVALKPSSGNGNTGSLIAQGTAIIAYFAPYFLLPMAARFATGAIGNIAGMINDRHRGAFDRLKGMRQQSMANTHQKRMEGKSWMGSGKTGQIYRRTAMMGKDGSWSPTAGGRAKFEQHERALREAHIAEALKNDNGRAANDDTANKVAMRHDTNGMNFVSRYADQAQGDAAAAGRTLSREDAERMGRDAKGLLETGYGAQMGSEAMQVTAFKARQMSVTGYGDSDEEVAQAWEDGRMMVQSGLMNASDVVGTMKQNKARFERSGVSFGTGVQMVSKGSRIDQADVDTMMGTMTEGLNPQSMVGARKEAVTVYSRHMQRQLERQVTQVEAAGGNPLQDAGVKRLVAHIASAQDTINQQAPQNRDILANGLLMQPVGTSGVRVRDFSDHLRTNADSDYNDVRKEWQTQQGAAGAAAAAAAAETKS